MTASASERHDRNWIATFEAMADGLPNGFRLGTPTVLVAATGTPISNKVIVIDPSPDPADLAAAVELVRARGVPYDVFVRSTYERALEVVADAGFVRGGDMPCMTCELPLVGPRRVPDGFEIRAVDQASMADFQAVAAEAFGMPAPMARTVFRPELLDFDDMRAFVGYVEDRPVACAASYQTDDIVGIYTVATVAAARGRGYGTAITAAAMVDTPAPATLAVLQASDMGRPVYERMGFRTVHQQAVFREPDAAHA